MRLITVKELSGEEPYSYSIKFNNTISNCRLFDKYAYILGKLREKHYDIDSSTWFITQGALDYYKILEDRLFPNKQVIPVYIPHKETINEKLFRSVLGYEDIGSDMKLKPFDYQKKAIKLALEIGGGIIKAACGAGKTPIGIGLYLEGIKEKLFTGPGLIVVKATLKSQWQDEIGKFSNLSSQIVRTPREATIALNRKIKKLEKAHDDSQEKELEYLRDNKTNAFAIQFKNADLYIANYEALRDEKICKELLSKHFEFVYADEIHYIKNDSSQRAKALYKFNTAKYKYGATATPVQKDPRDVYGIFHFIKPELFPNRSKFYSYYLKWGGRGIVVGVRHEDDLFKQISGSLISIPQDEVGKQLPKLVVIQKYCEFTPTQQENSDKLMAELDELHDKEKQLLNTLTEEEQKHNQELNKIEAGILMRQTFAQELTVSESLLKMSKSKAASNYVSASKQEPKLDLMVSLLEEILESGEKACIFSRFAQMQSIITDRIEKEATKKGSSFVGVKLAYVNGSLNSDARHEQINLFKKEPDYKILLCTNAAAEGVNLSNCKYMIELDLAESYALQKQRHGRLERADSVHGTVFVYQLIMKDSWDEIAEKIVKKKQYYDQTIVNGQTVDRSRN